MKTTHSIDALIPEVNTDFQCLGSDCPDTCCSGWEVSIDKDSFFEYRKNTNLELKDLFLNQLNREKNATPHRYATIRLNEQNGSCGFLDQGLCKIQKTLGANALSDTCSGYPRITLQHGDMIQQGLTLSCPEASRRTLLQEGIMQFVPSTVYTRKSQVTKIKSSSEEAAKVEREVRFFALRIMRTEELQTWQKISILGFFCEDLNSFYKKDAKFDPRTLINQYEVAMDDGSFLKSLSAIIPLPEIQVKIFSGILFSKLLKNNTDFQKKTLDKFLRNVFGDESRMTQVEFLSVMYENYNSGIKKLNLVLLESNKKHFMDNFLLNQMFNEGFPYNESNFFKSYLRLLARFGTLRMLLALSCSNSNDLPNVEELSSLTQVYARKFEHDPHFKSAVNDGLQGVGFESMKYVVGLIRD